MNRGLAAGFNPGCVYNFTQKILKKLAGYNFRVIRVYFDSLENPDKLSTYLSRRGGHQKSAKKFWDKGLEEKGRITISLLL